MILNGEKLINQRQLLFKKPNSAEKLGELNSFMKLIYYHLTTE